MTTTVVWFRRDLRLHDHPALTRAVGDGDRVSPLFVIDERLLSGRFGSPNRAWFLRGSVLALARELERRGASLTVLQGDPAALVPAFAASVGAGRVVASRDYTPFGRARDLVVAGRLAAARIAWLAEPGVLVREPEEIATASGGPFRRFAPFEVAWLSAARRVVLQGPDAIPAARPPIGRTSAASFPSIMPTADPALLPIPGEAAARERLDRWAGGSGPDQYDAQRDRLDLDGTSRLGADLRFGLVSPIEVIERCAGPGDGRRRFRSELAWRDFYAHVLWWEPRLARAAFRTGLDAVGRAVDPALIDAWRAGRTGFPVVDAAMRQLLAAGWMPNRARMIVASFLTRHLGADWRIGERHFMRHLVDGDPASNNGGWQWAASTGIDAQPWFRVFNPTLQGRRHDPDGSYVRRWVPELAHLPGPAAHEPPPGEYLPPIVDHADARARTLAAYRSAARVPVRPCPR